MNDFTRPRTAAQRSRQKNCNYCVWVKRRCDRRSPVCSRCAEKGIACSYTKDRRHPTHSDDRHFITSFSADEIPSFENPAVATFGADSSTHLDFMDSSGLLAENLPTGVSDSTTSLSDGFFLDAVEDENAAMNSLVNYCRVREEDSVDRLHTTLQIQDDPPIDRPHNDRPVSPLGTKMMEMSRKMDGFCEGVEPWHAYDPSKSLYYVVNQFKGFNTSIAKRNTTPFMHTNLYRDNTPSCMLTCFTVNVVYANRTTESTAMAIRVLQDSAKQLLQAETGRVDVGPMEKLARTHALFSYQVIRILDGDIGLRAQADKDLPLLKTWVGELVAIRDNLGVSSRVNTCQMGAGAWKPGAWEKWIFAESVRRTIIMAYSFLVIYDVMKGTGPLSESEPWHFANRWTLSRPLWQAKSQFEFARAWADRPQHIITNYILDHFMACGRADDVDEFGEIVLSMYMGIQEAKEFLSGREK